MGPRHLNYHHLRYFWTVAREKSLTKAARHLHLSQSALSLQLKALEQSLGVALFNRSHKSLQLTEAGKLAFDYATVIFKNGMELLNALDGAPHLHHQTLSIGAVSTLSRNFAMELIKPLISRPGLKLSLRSGNLRELLVQLQSHTVDLVLSNQPVRTDIDNHLSNRLVSEQPVSLVAAPGFKLSPGKFPACLKDIPLILPSHESALRVAFDVMLEEAGVIPNVIAEIDDMAMLRLFTREAKACALLPPVVVQDELRMKWLKEILPLPFLKETFYLITSKRQFPNPLIRSLLKDRH